MQLLTVVIIFSGGIATLWCLLFAILIYDSPSQHPRISPEEKQYIRLSVGEKPARVRFLSVHPLNAVPMYFI